MLSSSQQCRIMSLYMELELIVERLGLSSQPQSPSKLQHLHLQEIMQNSPQCPARFEYRTEQYTLQQPHLQVLFPFSNSNPSKLSPLK